jgi:hypothetical protein
LNRRAKKKRIEENVENFEILHKYHDFRAATVMLNEFCGSFLLRFFNAIFCNNITECVLF